MTNPSNMESESGLTSYNQDSERTKRLIAMGQMAATLAHEIRNPLGSMELFCTLLKKELAGNTNSLNLAEQIHVGIRRLEAVISNCLQFTREVRPTYEKIGLSRFIDDTLAFVQPQARQLHVEVGCRVDCDIEIEVDSELLGQALLNILVNALDSVEEKFDVADKSSAGAQGRIEVSTEVLPSGYFRLVVSDNGIGIDEADRSQVFDPFFSTKKSGTGLGLSVVHSIISAHRGSITIESEKGTGTKVLIMLPVRQ